MPFEHSAATAKGEKGFDPRARIFARGFTPSVDRAPAPPVPRRRLRSRRSRAPPQVCCPRGGKAAPGARRRSTMALGVGSRWPTRVLEQGRRRAGQGVLLRRTRCRRARAPFSACARPGRVRRWRRIARLQTMRIMARVRSSFSCSGCVSGRRWAMAARRATMPSKPS